MNEVKENFFVKTKVIENFSAGFFLSSVCRVEAEAFMSEPRYGMYTRKNEKKHVLAPG